MRKEITTTGEIERLWIDGIIMTNKSFSKCDTLIKEIRSKQWVSLEYHEDYKQRIIKHIDCCVEKDLIDNDTLIALLELRTNIAEGDYYEK